MSTSRAQAVGLPLKGPSEWRNLFAKELIRLAPRLNPDAADEFADSQFLISGHAEPAPAASVFANEQGYSARALGPKPIY